MCLYLDACIVIYLVERHPTPEVPVREQLRKRAPQGLTLCWSDLTRMETRVLPLREKQTERRAHLERFYAEPVAERVAITRQIFELATQLRAGHALNTPDALHLAAAIEAGCDELWTNDRRLEAAAGGQLHTLTF